MLQDLKERLRRAEARMDAAESDGEWEAARQVVIYLRELANPDRVIVTAKNKDFPLLSNGRR